MTACKGNGGPRYRWAAGEMIMGSRDGKLCTCVATSSSVEMLMGGHDRPAPLHAAVGTSEVIERAMAQLDEYFAGERREFTIPLLQEGTEFRLRVWRELMKIPYGTTITYGELARRVGVPKGARAVASAVAANPLLIFVPCHRVVGSNGKLGGYSGGIEAKRALLALEAM